ncbi:SDR family NAD(P)-dependent oxidoreductase [Haloprofundus halobius]|uniref:SDR family NAD(P)-dependent oxidoreductase n=1 Tax=Haloprofundus halobius TaxID=2876194 RepID=UPI001CC98DD6|nr:SDR family oxidoreductase [Haloprofundus halobius]
MSRVALVTGASRGLGSVLASFLAADGYDLVLTARDPDPLNVVATSLADLDVDVTPLPGDVVDADHRRSLREAAEDLGGLSLLVNNASALGPSPLPPLAELSTAEFERVLSVNTVAPLALIRETLPLLRESGGLVVNVSSDAAVGGYPRWGGYGASKAALDLLTKTLAAEEPDVGFVSVDPGDMRTAMHRRAFPDEDISDRPLPEVTLPFWAWLFGRDPQSVSGRRFEAQSELWESA